MFKRRIFIISRLLFSLLKNSSYLPVASIIVTGFFLSAYSIYSYFKQSNQCVNIQVLTLFQTVAGGMNRV